MNLYHAILDNGGEVFVNRMGGYRRDKDATYHVDVFDWCWTRGDDPVYHRCFDNEADAIADAKTFKHWEES